MYAPGTPSGNAQWALGLAIASWVACGIFTALPAFFMARAELKAIERGEAPAAGKGMAQGAFWVALVNVALTLLIVIPLVIFFFVVAASA